MTKKSLLILSYLLLTNSISFAETRTQAQIDRNEFSTDSGPSAKKGQELRGTCEVGVVISDGFTNFAIDQLEKNGFSFKSTENAFNANYDLAQGQLEVRIGVDETKSCDFSVLGNYFAGGEYTYNCETNGYEAWISVRTINGSVRDVRESQPLYSNYMRRLSTWRKTKEQALEEIKVLLKANLPSCG